MQGYIDRARVSIRVRFRIRIRVRVKVKLRVRVKVKIRVRNSQGLTGIISTSDRRLESGVRVIIQL